MNAILSWAARCLIVLSVILLILNSTNYPQTVSAQTWPNPWPTAGWLCNLPSRCDACFPCDRCDLKLGPLTNYCNCVNGASGCDRQNTVIICSHTGAFNEFCTNNQNNCGNTFNPKCKAVYDWVELVVGSDIWIWMVVSCDNLGCVNSGSVSPLCKSCDMF